MISPDMFLRLFRGSSILPENWLPGRTFSNNKYYQSWSVVSSCSHMESSGIGQIIVPLIPEIPSVWYAGQYLLNNQFHHWWSGFSAWRYKAWLCTQIRGGSTSTHSIVVNFRSTESFNPCPERETATTIALWRPSLAGWKMKCSMDLRRIIPPLKPSPRRLPSILTITITAESKPKQNGCLPLNSGKHPWWNLNYSILIQCPENWVHINIWTANLQSPWPDRPAAFWSVILS